MNPTKKSQLFIITGASGVGKSALCEVLFKDESRYIVLESDLLWNSFFDTPEDNYLLYRRTWLNICANISQIGLPVVLCGCVTPEQMELLPEREQFTDIYYAAAVCDSDCLKTRLTKGRNITDENHIKSSLSFNDWLIKNSRNTSPPITIVDTTDMNSKQAANVVDEWILTKL